MDVVRHGGNGKELVTTVGRAPEMRHRDRGGEDESVDGSGLFEVRE